MLKNSIVVSDNDYSICFLKMSPKISVAYRDARYGMRYFLLTYMGV